jgi:dipeptidyl aminopeptidase/acylaminoacyl peptidase
MKTKTFDGCPTRKTALPPLALTACAVVAVSLACGGSSESQEPGTSPTMETPVVQATVALPPVPPDSAERAGLLVYQDTFAGQILALNLATGERLPVTGILTSAVNTVTAFDCSRDGRQIAYVNPAGNGTVGIVSFAGEGARSQSVEIQGAIVGMSWSPQGDRMAMSVIKGVEYSILLLDVASGTTTPLATITGLPGTPRWSPDGQRLVLEINNRGISDIYIIDLAAPNPVKISGRPSALNPDWSPNGITIIYSAGDDEGGLPQIYAIDADGKNERKLTASTPQKYIPRWSLDGSLMSYTGLIITPVVSRLPVLSHNQAIWVAGADGTNEVPVTDLSLDAQPLAWCLRGTWL